MNKIMRCVLMVLVIAGCQKEPIAPVDPSALVIDSLDVRILRDDAPGFLYARYYHEMRSTAHIPAGGFIHTYIYRAADIGCEESIDGGWADPSAFIRHTVGVWSGYTLPVGQGTPVYVELGASVHGGAQSSVSLSMMAYVEAGTGLPIPERAARQLSGPVGRGLSPVISRDGQRVYYRQEVFEDPAHASICAVNVANGLTNVLATADNQTFRFGGHALADGDSSLLIVLRVQNQRSRLITRHLIGGGADTVEVQGFLGNSDFRSVPGTPYGICLAQSASNPSTGVNLVLLDRRTGGLETLATVPSNAHLGVRPGTRTVTWAAPDQEVGQGLFVHGIDLETRASSLLLSEASASDVVWAPNGIDNALLLVEPTHSGVKRNRYALVKNGVLQDITSYPGEHSGLTFAADAPAVSFAANRRGEWQVWWLPL